MCKIPAIIFQYDILGSLNFHQKKKIGSEKDFRGGKKTVFPAGGEGMKLLSPNQQQT